MKKQTKEQHKPFKKSLKGKTDWAWEFLIIILYGVGGAILGKILINNIEFGLACGMIAGVVRQVSIDI